MYQVMIMRKHQCLDVSQEELKTEAHESWSIKVRSMDDHATCMVLVPVMVLKCHKVPDWYLDPLLQIHSHLQIQMKEWLTDSVKGAGWVQTQRNSVKGRVYPLLR